MSKVAAVLVYVIFITFLIASCDLNKLTAPENGDKEPEHVGMLKCKLDLLGDLDFSEDISTQYRDNYQFGGRFCRLIWCRGDSKYLDHTVFIVFQLWTTADLLNGIEFKVSEGIQYDKTGFWLHITYDGSRTYKFDEGVLRIESFDLDKKKVSGSFQGKGIIKYMEQEDVFSVSEGVFTLYDFN